MLCRQNGVHVFLINTVTTLNHLILALKQGLMTLA